MIQSIYIMSAGGIPVCSFEFKKESQRDPILFSGMLSAIQTFLIEVNVGELKKFTTQTTEVFIEVLIDFTEKSDYYAITLIKDIDDQIPEEALQVLIANISRHIKQHIAEIDTVRGMQRRLERIITDLVSCWESDQKEDRAVKKLKEGLW